MEDWRLRWVSQTPSEYLGSGEYFLKLHSLQEGVDKIYSPPQIISCGEIKYPHSTPICWGHPGRNPNVQEKFQLLESLVVTTTRSCFMAYLAREKQEMEDVDRQITGRGQQRDFQGCEN